MTTIYVASFCTYADYECLRDDHGMEDMESYAIGMTACAGLDRAKVLEVAKRMLEAEMIDTEELTEDDELTYAEEDSGTTQVSLGAEPAACIVIREFEGV